VRLVSEPCFLPRNRPAIRLRLAVIACLVACGLSWCGRAAAASPPPPEAATARYTLGLLYRGRAFSAQRRPQDDSLQAGHLANMRRMAAEGVLIGAGPYADDAGPLGVFVFRADSSFDLQPLLARDPSLASGRFRVELHALAGWPGIGRDYFRRAGRPDHPPDSMVTYSLALLRRGPKWTSNVPPSVERVLRHHAEHVERLRRDGSLIFAGGIEGRDDLRGLFVFAADTGRARELVRRDPAVRAGRFVAEIHPWWVAFGVLPGH